MQELDDSPVRTLSLQDSDSGGNVSGGQKKPPRQKHPFLPPRPVSCHQLIKACVGSNYSTTETTSMLLRYRSSVRFRSKRWTLNQELKPKFILNYSFTISSSFHSEAHIDNAHDLSPGWYWCSVTKQLNTKQIWDIWPIVVKGYMRYLAIPPFVVNGCSFDHNLDFNVLLGWGWPSLLGLFDCVQHAVVLRLPVPLLDVHVHIHVLKSKFVFVSSNVLNYTFE